MATLFHGMRLVTKSQRTISTWCGYEVPGMVLLRDFKGAMRLAPSKDVSVHV
jgi:hypothetical protein